MSRTTRSRALVAIAAGALMLSGAVPLTRLAASASTDLLNTSGPVTLFPELCTNTIRVVLPPEYGATPTEPAQPCSANVDPWLDGTTLDTYRDQFQRHPVLSWAPITDRTVSTYEVQISPDATFTNLVQLPGDGMTTATQFELPASLPHASYFWRVRGWNADGEHTDWSGTTDANTASVWQFTKSWFDAPVPLAPLNGAASLVFSWSAIPDASSYELQIGPNPLYSSDVTLDCVTNHTSYTPYTSTTGEGATEGSCGANDAVIATNVTSWAKDHPSYNGTLYWRVRGIDGTDSQTAAAVTTGNIDCTVLDCSNWSSYLAGASQPVTARWAATSLTAGDPLNAPSGLQLLNCGSQPGSGEPTCADTPTLSWTPNPAANRYLVDVSWDPTFASVWREYQVADAAITPIDDFPDAQAGRTYYWRVRSCWIDDSQSSSSSSTGSSSGSSSSSPSSSSSSSGPGGKLLCGAGWDTTSPRAAFHKLSVPLPSVAQNTGAALQPGTSTCTTTGQQWLGLYVTVNNAEHFCNATSRVGSYASVTLHWDYYHDYLAAAGAGVTQEAKQYRVQLASTPNFDKPITSVVDGNRWTKADGLLADGTWYWRVQPVDGSGYGLPWTQVMSFVKGPIVPTAQIHGSGVLVPGAPITVDVSVPLKTATVSAGSIGISDAVSHTHVTATVKVRDAATVVVIPNQPLPPGARVSVWTDSSLRDAAGNHVAAATDVRTVAPLVDSTSGLFAQSWERIADAAASGGGLVHSANWDDALTFTFTGSDLTLLARTGPDGGQATVTLDAGDASIVDFYSASAVEQAQVWKRAGLGSGSHTVTVVVGGNHSAGSAGNDVAIDGFLVGGVAHQETDGGVSMTWATHRATDAVGTSYQTEQQFTPTQATTAAPAVQTLVYGTTITLGACLSPDGGLADVYVDGVKLATVDFYQGYSSCNSTLFTSKKLSDAPHTVRIVDDGAHRTGGSGTKVSLDWLSVAS